MGYIGFRIWGFNILHMQIMLPLQKIKRLIAIVSIYYAIRVEKHKKNSDIQTYREILGFLDRKSMDELQRNQEYGKRPYQKFFIVTGVGVLNIVVSVIKGYILL